VTADPIPLDRYAATLRELTTAGNAVPIHAVACKVQGGATPRAKRAARTALDELVARGLAEMPFPGRYRAPRAPAGHGLEGSLPIYVNGVPLTSREIDVEVTEDDLPRLDEPGFAGVALGRALSLHDDEVHGPLSEGELAAMQAAEPEDEPEEPPPPSPPEPPVTLDPIERLAGSFMPALLGVSEYPDAIIAEAEVFAKRAARALDVARAERERAEAEERGAFEAWNRARDSREAARERVKRLERIAQGVE